MTNFLRKLPAMMFAMIALTIVGCNTNEDPVDPTNEKPNAPTALMARSVSETQVALKWTAPTSGPTPTGYLIMYSEVGGSTGTQEISVSGGSTTSGTVPGLTDGKVYEFMVHAVNGTVESDASNKVNWAPARRGTGAYRLYSSNSSTNGSGLAIFSGTAPSVELISNGGQWDICFDDKTSPSDPRIASPGQTQYVDNNFQFPNGQDARVVYWGKQYTGITSLDDIYDTDALTIPAADGEKFWSLNSIGGTSNWGSVIGVKNADNTVNFAKVLVKRTGGTFVQGSGAGAYIEVEVSYQTMKDVPYALKQKMEQWGQQVRTPVRAND